METYNIYMDEAPAAGDANGDEGWEVEFRVVGQSIDDGDPENNAVLAGLDLVDLINLRDALQQEIDNFALTALETQAMVGRYRRGAHALRGSNQRGRYPPRLALKVRSSPGTPVAGSGTCWGPLIRAPAGPQSDESL